MRIGLTGPTSTGKTSLAQEFSVQLGVPFLNVDTTTELNKFGFKSHAELLAAGLSANRAFQAHLIGKRAELLEANPVFITDRTPLDSLVYYYMESMRHPHPEDEALQQFVFDTCAKYDALVLVRYGNLPLKENGVRIHSDMYHRTTDMLFKYLCDKFEMAKGRVVINLSMASGLQRLQYVAAAANQLRLDKSTPEPFSRDQINGLTSAYG